MPFHVNANRGLNDGNLDCLSDMWLQETWFSTHVFKSN
nr:MAG TPA: hypothetical protein [Caudoviricetes sp.]